MEPIVVSRSTGAIISAPVLTQEQKNAAWEAIIRAHVRRHPEILKGPDAECEGTTA